MKNIWFLTVFIQVGFIQLSFSQVKEEQPVFKLHAGDFNKFLAKKF